MNKDLNLVIIDFQNDFCDLPNSYISNHYIPSLPITGSHFSALHTTKLIYYLIENINSIQVFLDTHQRYDIGHFDFWSIKGVTPILKITEITKQDFENNLFTPIQDVEVEVMDYFNKLETININSIWVYPPHCIYGTIGHNIHPNISAAIACWEIENTKNTKYILKGTEPISEHYSGLKAVYPEINKPSTLMNLEAVNKYLNNKVTVFVGQASTHCVPQHIQDAIDYIQESKKDFDFSRFIILTDCMNPIPGFEYRYDNFINIVKSLGVRVMTSLELIELYREK